MAPQREWLEKDYYKILGVSEKADAKEITKAYRKLARANHPDANPDDAGAEDRFKEASAAYDVVGNAEKRKEYDEVRAMGPMGGFSPGPGGTRGTGGAGGPGGGFGFDPSAMGGNIGDVLGGMFGRGGGGGGRRQSRGTGPQRGADLEAEIHLGFADAIAGLTTTLNLVSDAVCHVCAGVGAEPGTVPTPCGVCHGRGVVEDDQGFFATSRPCPNCGGRGSTIEKPCKNCRGVGIERRPREVKARIPAGVADKQRIRLKGRGDPGRNGGPPGDLFVICRVESHEVFTMDGRNLKMTAPITFAEAALGADISVPTIDAKRVKLRMPAGTRTGRTFRVKGRGVATSKGTGDLMVTVEVAVPTKLTAAERKAVETLRDLAEESPRAHLDASTAPPPPTETDDSDGTDDEAATSGASAAGS